MDFLITPALAETASGGSSMFLNLLFPILLVVVFYFLLIRPQTKRAKEHRNMVEALQTGDEIVTSGGVVGRITEVGGNFIAVQVSEQTNLRIQKNAVASLMPKGSLDSDL